MPSEASKTLETFENPQPERDYTIRIRVPEFTCLCPKTGQPDFATLHLEYVPDRRCVELKSLKLYVWSYRDEGAFHEAVTNRILDDLVQELPVAHPARLVILRWSIAGRDDMLGWLIAIEVEPHAILELFDRWLAFKRKESNQQPDVVGF